MRGYPTIIRSAMFMLELAAALVVRTDVAQASRLVRLDDLTNIRELDDPQISPEGTWVAYIVSSTDVEQDAQRSDLWMVSWDGKQHVQLTFDTTSAATPRWSPDGRYISYLAAHSAEDDKRQLWVIDRRGGQPRRLTNVALDISDYAWSPDGKRLALVARAPRVVAPAKSGKEQDATRPQPIVIDRYYFKNDTDGYLTGDRFSHIYLYEIESAALARLTAEDAYQESAPAWSPDGEQIAFISNRHGAQWDRTVNADVHVAPVRLGPPPRRLTTFEGRDAGPLSWSPDGQRIAYVQGVDPQYYIYGITQVAVVSLTGDNAVVLAPALDRDVEQPQFSADGRFVEFLVEDDGSVYPARVAATGGMVRRLLDANAVTLRHARNRDHTVLLMTTDEAPAELYAVEQGGLRKLTSHNDGWLRQVRLAATERFSFRSTDGTEVHGLLTVPPAAAARPPAIFWLHGGPYSQHAHDFDLARQLFVAAGYAVVEVNVRGSSGRGAAYGRSIYADWGKKDVEDVLAAVDHLAARQRIDPALLGIGGWSYGGVLTNYVIATDRRFKAAISGAGVANQLSMYGSDQYVFPYEREFGLPWRDAQRWIQLSYPFFHADRIRTPTLFLGGDRDFNVPIAGGEQMYQALKSLQVPTQLVIYPGEKHRIVRPSFVRDRLQRYLSWFGQYLQTTGALVARGAGES